MSDLARKAGVARTSHPENAVEGQHVIPTYDKVGRSIVQPFCMREMIATAVATLLLNDATHGADPDNETELIAGDADYFLDPYYIYGANASDAAVRIAFRAGAGGADIIELDIPANGVSILNPPLPYPQSEVDQAWYVDWAVNDNIADVDDVTNTVTTVGGYFIRNR